MRGSEAWLAAAHSPGAILPRGGIPPAASVIPRRGSQGSGARGAALPHAPRWFAALRVMNSSLRQGRDSWLATPLGGHTRGDTGDAARTVDTIARDTRQRGLCGEAACVSYSEALRQGASSVLVLAPFTPPGHGRPCRIHGGLSCNTNIVFGSAGQRGEARVWQRGVALASLSPARGGAVGVGCRLARVYPQGRGGRGVGSGVVRLRGLKGAVPTSCTDVSPRQCRGGSHFRIEEEEEEEDDDKGRGGGFVN
ncbi:hypothetical protein O3P69_017706 [Scylla paramamosain]|uniref:Uncharacterized protein n=1 Tax=Scylla paramamosain TaxID=85552 RepID=A0AAW0TYP4_SCYPA